MKLHKTTHTQLAHWFGFISAYKLMFVCGIVVPWPKICSRFNTRRVVKDTLSKAWFTYLWHAHGLCQAALPFLFVCWWAEPPVAHLLGMTISIAPAIWITSLLVVALTWWFPVFCPPTPPNSRECCILKSVPSVGSEEAEEYAWFRSNFGLNPGHCTKLLAIPKWIL